VVKCFGGPFRLWHVKLKHNLQNDNRFAPTHEMKMVKRKGVKT
jgi:hypothetical protein